MELYVNGDAHLAAAKKSLKSACEITRNTNNQSS